MNWAGVTVRHHHTGENLEEIKRKIVGRRQGKKADVCWVIEQRLKCRIAQPAGYHISDAAAAGLLAWDERQWAERTKGSERRKQYA